MALKVRVGRLGREMFPSKGCKGIKGAPDRTREVQMSLLSSLVQLKELCPIVLGYREGSKSLLQPLPPAFHSLCTPGHSPGAAACPFPGKCS